MAKTEYQLNLVSKIESFETHPYVPPFNLQLLKWIGNKQRFAPEIITYFPAKFGTYIEPFLGSGGVLGTLNPQQAIGSDNFQPLIEIWTTLKNKPEEIIDWYSERWLLMKSKGKKEGYEIIKERFNKHPNGADLLFISRSCYGGVIRFRKGDGYISTPVGIHDPISPKSFSYRALKWSERIRGTSFICSDYRGIMKSAKKDDLIYCDPPYVDSQSILYGAQLFNIMDLFTMIADCKNKGVFVALSIDGSKKSGMKIIDIPFPEGLFEHQIKINVGRSMLKRFQMEGETLESEYVRDLLLLTY
ncbi:MAG: DNA adenine methylase [Candidatus Methanofastidiosa archaeon]|nr:DNA adenine methylase [Candidatus Methanofastidiosa archaeon]